MLVRVVPVLATATVFCTGLVASGGGWFESHRVETLMWGLLAAIGLFAAGQVAAAGFWVVNGRAVQTTWVLSAALLLATPVDVTLPAQGLDSVRVMVLPLLDAIMLLMGLPIGPFVAYQDATVFPGAGVTSLPQSPLIATALIAALALATARTRTPGVRARGSKAMLLALAREGAEAHRR